MSTFSRDFAADRGNTIRRNKNNGATKGSGLSKHFYVGRYGSYDYDAFVRFATDWSLMGRIVSATLYYYTGDGLGDTPSTTTETPKLAIRRLTATFATGNAPDGTWEANDYTNPASTATGAKTVRPTRAELGLNSVDVTDFVRKWAPASVGGSRLTNYGIKFSGTTDTHQNIDLCGDLWTDTALRPKITVVAEYGHTTPSAPSTLTPNGSVSGFTDFQGDFADVDTDDRLLSSDIQLFDAGKSATAAVNNTITSSGHLLQNGDIIYLTSVTDAAPLATFTAYYVISRTDTTFKLATTSGGTEINITETGSFTWSKRLYAAGPRTVTTTEADAAHFTHVPSDLTLLPGTYRWRARVQDSDGDWSSWSSLTSFEFTNNAPNAPTLSPTSGYSGTSPDGLHFEGTFSDPDDGDTLLAYQCQMSAYPEGDARWDQSEFILWETGKRYVPSGDTSFDTPYEGAGLAAGTYYWRARVWDNKQTASAWSYATITFSATYESDPSTTSTAIQLRPRAPWRIVIKDLGTLRGPGNVVAILEDAKNVGASELYNSPGELHFTLPKDHPQISVIEPRQTHYAVEFRQGDGWHEVFAGLIMDFDASDTDVIFYGTDYLGLLDAMIDERYDPSNPDKAAESGGSKYVTTGKNNIGYIVHDQLVKSSQLANSPTGFIGRAQSAATLTTLMGETLTVYSTYTPVLQFIAGLLDSHRAGSGKRTRLRVRKNSSGGYEYVIDEDPGTTRDNLRLRYGELVQGYRVVAFGTDWASRVAGIGRAKDGIKVMYEQQTAPSIAEATWGRFTRVNIFDGVSDANDLRRRVRQAATQGGKLGKQIGLGLRSSLLQPKDGFDVCDNFPLDIEDGSVSTSAFGSGYWTCVGVTWETNAQDGKQNTTLTFQPKEDTSAPSADLLTLQPISAQKQWQIGWTSPNPLVTESLYWLDQSTGTVYVRTDGVLVAEGITGTA